jgi:uncharacterized membrane protein YjjB (DUF3815 family)
MGLIMGAISMSHSVSYHNGYKMRLILGAISMGLIMGALSIGLIALDIIMLAIKWV